MTHPQPPSQTLRERITDYLCNGGFFNPEMMEHDKVRALLMDRRDALAAQEASHQPEIAQRYYELLYAVSRKHPNESRHETALRYIRQAEEPKNDQTAARRQEQP